MTRIGYLLSLSAGLMLSLSPASAVTVFSISGTATTCASTGGNAGNPATGIVTAAAWTQANGYSNVSISAALDNLPSQPAFTQFTVFLTTALGPGTTAAQEIAHATVTGNSTAAASATLTSLFTGLTLPPGTYFLTIYGDVNGAAQGPQCWSFSPTPTTVADAGVTNLRDFQGVGVASYPPASSLSPVANVLFTQVTGTLIATPTISKSFGSAPFFAGSTDSLTFTIQNTNATTLTGVAFTDTLPAGLVVATPNGLATTCAGTVTATAGSSSISLSGATLAAGGSCTISLNVLATSTGNKINTTSTLTSNQAAPGAAATASVLVFPALDTPFQVSYAANPAAGESYINIINDGANGASLMGPGIGGPVGNICVNAYAFSPDEQLISCCSCLLTPNAVSNLGVNRDLTVKTLTGVIPTSVVIKLVATLAGANGTGTSCAGSAAVQGTLAKGMVAFGTTPQPVGTVYNAVGHTFIPATLSAGEYASITNRCANNIGNGSGFGICSSCRAGALGADKQ